jgi:Uma2 family endonuclease
MAIDLSIRPITTDEYRRMAEAGIIGADERVELLDGLLVEMPPIGVPHVFAHGLVVEHLIERLGRKFFVAGEASIPLSPRDEPQPDVAIFRREILSTKSKSEWNVRDIVALIEISDSSIGRDIGPKLRRYALADVAEYLVVDLNRRRIIRHRRPRDGGYDSVEMLGPPDTFALDAAPDASLQVEAFFPPA